MVLFWEHFMPSVHFLSVRIFLGWKYLDSQWRCPGGPELATFQGLSVRIFLGWKYLDSQWGCPGGPGLSTFQISSDFELFTIRSLPSSFASFLENITTSMRTSGFIWIVRERYQLSICFICQLGFPMEQVNVGVCYEFISLGGHGLVFLFFWEHFMQTVYFFLPRLFLDNQVVVWYEVWTVVYSCVS